VWYQLSDARKASALLGLRLGFKSVRFKIRVKVIV
jgi:hypothetical protein